VLDLSPLSSLQQLSVPFGALEAVAAAAGQLPRLRGLEACGSLAGGGGGDGGGSSLRVLRQLGCCTALEVLDLPSVEAEGQLVRWLRGACPQLRELRLKGGGDLLA
jgi:hypothetical protein